MKILLMTDMYYPYFNANGLCIDKIRKELQKNGNEMHILCFKRANEKTSEMYEGVYIHRVRPRFFFWMLWYYEKHFDENFGKIVYWLAFLQNKFFKILYFYWHPLASFSGLKRYENTAKKICKEYGIDVAVGQYVPLEAAYTVAQLKKTEKCKTILYVVDSFSNCVTAEKSKLVENRNWKWEQRLYPKVDMVINMECHRNHHEQKRYDEYRDKMVFSDVPMLCPFDEAEKLKFDEMDFSKWNIIYNGTISNLEAFKMLVDVLNSEKFKQKICLNIASKPSAYVDTLVKEYDFIKYMGYLPTQKMQNALLNANAILSVGVYDSEMIPSKLFVSLSSGKKIVHIGAGKKDSCIKYLKKYSNAYIADISDYTSEQSKRILINSINSAIEAPDYRIPYEEIERLYYENTAGYTAKIIKDIYSK